MKRIGVSVVIWASCIVSCAAQGLLSEPQMPGEEIFSHLRKASPFLRTLSISDTYALRGVAKFDDIEVATLYNRETKKTILVTPEEENEYGLKLVKIVEGKDLSGVSAEVSFGGEVAQVKYEQDRLAPKPKMVSGKPVVSSSPGGSPSGSKRRGPSEEDRKRYLSLSEEKKAKLREYIGNVMKKYPDLPREEKGNLIRGALSRLSDGQDISTDPQVDPRK